MAPAAQLRMLELGTLMLWLDCRGLLRDCENRLWNRWIVHSTSLKTTFPRAMPRTSALRGECRGGEQLKLLRTCHRAAGRGRALATSSWRPQPKSDLMILNWITRTSTRLQDRTSSEMTDRQTRHNGRGIRLFKYLQAPTVAAVTGGELQNFAGRQKSNYTKISNFPFIGDRRCRHHRR